MATITVTGLEKHFGTAHVIKGLTLNVTDRAFVTLLGPSGCGKTTILRMLAGFVQPDGGEIAVDGRVLSSAKAMVPPEQRQMGMVFQSYALWPHMTVFENVAFGLRLKRLPRAAVERRVEGALAMVGLERFGDRAPGMLSGGQQQRVALARSLVTEPSILLLDEPLSNLDAKLRERMRVELKDLHRRTGVTFVYVTHDQAEAMVLSDRVAVVRAGVLQQYASPREVYDRPANRFVADFMGAVNLLDGVVEEPVPSGDGTGLVVLRSGARLAAALPGGAGKGEPVTVLVRPEDIELRDEAPGHAGNVFRGAVLDCVFLGNLIDYRVAVQGTELRAQAPRGQVYEKDSQIYLWIDPSRCRALVEQDTTF